MIEKTSLLKEQNKLWFWFTNQVCDGTTSTNQACDELCGGAGCGKCGGLSCLNGALSKAEGAVKSAESADKMLVEKDRKAERVFIDITKVHQKSQAAADTAQVNFELNSYHLFKINDYDNNATVVKKYIYVE